MSKLAELDLARWAVVAHKDQTGFGRMADDLRAVLGIGRHLVVPSERLSDRPLSGKDEAPLPSTLAAGDLRALLERLQGIIFFERHNWHPALLPTARELSVRTVCVPMWEWFRGSDDLWKYCDLFLCPNELCLRTVRSYGWRNCLRLPWCLNIARFDRRIVTGPARLFIHNAGLVDHDDRKGTFATVQAFEKVAEPRIKLLIRAQKDPGVKTSDGRIEIRVGNIPDPAELYREGDAAIQPSKMEGIGFMVLEPLAAGLPVITTDQAPMNEYVRQRELLVKKRWFKRRAFPSAWIPQAHLRLPQVNDLSKKIAWCAVQPLESISRANLEWTGREFDPAGLRELWRGALESVWKGGVQRASASPALP